MIRWVPPDPPYREAVRALLTTTAITVGQRNSTLDLDGLLRTAAIEKARAWGLPGVDAASRLVREARYQVTRTISIQPRDRDDPLIGIVIEVLNQHPADPVARVLHAAAMNLSGPAPLRS